MSPTERPEESGRTNATQDSTTAPKCRVSLLRKSQVGFQASITSPKEVTSAKVPFVLKKSEESGPNGCENGGTVGDTGSTYRANCLMNNHVHSVALQNTKADVLQCELKPRM